jgi:MPBQ/MSBQ methyltransferase
LSTAAERALLAHGRADAGWHNLGLWQPGDHYDDAAARLALAVIAAARLQADARVLVVAFGAGGELGLLLQAGAASVLAIEVDAVNAAAAAQRHAGDPRITVQCADAMGIDLPRQAFDAVLCIDAAYHLAPRARWLGAMARCLRPGGRIAFCDLVADARPWPLPLLWQLAARGADIAAGEIVDGPAALARLQGCGFVDGAVQRLDDAVLGGFAHFVRQHSLRLGAAAGSAAWRRPRATARAIGACRAGGLGYAIFSATASAERTALSSSGTPASA